jgi:hypothetical protein
MAGSMSSDAGSSGGTPHAVALYGSVEELRRRVMPFLRAGLIAGDTVLAVVSQPAAAGLQDALGTERGKVRWELPGVSYDNLGPMFDGLRRYLADQHEAGNRIRLLAENAAPADATRTAAYLRFEAASNDVPGRYGFPWACLYDRRRYLPTSLNSSPRSIRSCSTTTASPQPAMTTSHPTPTSTPIPGPCHRSRRRWSSTPGSPPPTSSRRSGEQPARRHARSGFRHETTWTSTLLPEKCCPTLCELPWPCPARGADDRGG